MTTVRILDGDTERIQSAPLKDGSLAAVTGSATVVVAVQRVSDGQWLDWNDDTFKASGWTTRQQTMTEVSATLAPGEYRHDFDTSAITNAAADDTYMVHLDDTSGTAVNVPQVGEIKIDQWPAAILEDTAAIDARLPSDPADESIQLAAHAQTQADVAALNDLSQADVQAAMTAQGYTSGRASNLDDLDAAVSSRATQAEILSDATPFPGGNIDAAISSRSDFDEATDPVELLDSGGAAGTSAAELVADIDAELTTQHGAGSWQGSSLTSQQVRDAMKLAPTGGAPAAGSVDQHLDDIEADTAAIEPLATANLDAAVSSRSSHSAADVDTAITGSHGAGSYQTATGFATPGDAMDLVTDAVDADAVATSGAQEIRDEILDDATRFSGADIDAAISSRSSHSAADVDAQLSGSHGAGSWEGTSPAAVDAELTANHGAGAWTTATATATAECHLSAAYVDSGGAERVRVSAWLDRSDQTVTAPTDCTIAWYSEGGALLFTKSLADPELTGPDARGVFTLITAAGDFALTSKRADYCQVTITDGTGTVTTTRGVPTAG